MSSSPAYLMSSHLTLSLVLWVLLSAVLHAGWNFLLKSSKDSLLDSVAMAIGGSMWALALIPFFPLPAPESWPWLAASVALQMVYFLSLVKTYQYADLSMAYPLFRGTAPVLVAAWSFVHGESLGGVLLGGIALIALGIMLPSLLGMRRGLIHPKGLAFSALTALLIASYTLVDGLGVRASGAPVSYALYMFLLNSIGIFVVTWIRRGSVLLQQCRGRLWFGIKGSLLGTSAYGIVLYAMSVAPIAAVAALRETSVIFAALMGSFFLNEKLQGPRIVGAVVVAAGGAMMRWV